MTKAVEQPAPEPEKFEWWFIPVLLLLLAAGAALNGKVRGLRLMVLLPVLIISSCGHKKELAVAEYKLREACIKARYIPSNCEVYIKHFIELSESDPVTALSYAQGMLYVIKMQNMAEEQRIKDSIEIDIVYRKAYGVK